MLGDRTDQLVLRLVDRLRPGITSATDGLSDDATRIIMEFVHDLVGGDEAKQVIQCIQTRGWLEYHTCLPIV